MARLLHLLFAGAAASSLLCIGSADVLADTSTRLVDQSEQLALRAPGTWRKEPTELALKASGFMGVYRAELYAELYEAEPNPDAAARTWKAKREERGDGPTHSPQEGDPRRWVTRSGKGDLTEYCRAVPGIGKTAVVWIRIGRAPGEVDADAFAILASAEISAPATAEVKPPTADPVADFEWMKDPEHRIEIRLPKGFWRNAEVTPGLRRAGSWVGPMGSDPEAYVDLYAFPDFNRLEAAGWWWVARERRGWHQGVRIEGEPPIFRVMVEDETWNRLVKIVPTDAGIFAVRVDVEAGSDKAAATFLEGMYVGEGIRVLKPLEKDPKPPQGFQIVEHDSHRVFSEVPADKCAEVLRSASMAEVTVAKIMGLEPWDGAKGVIRIHADQQSLDNAARPFGAKDGTPVFWNVGQRVIMTHAGAAADLEGRGRLQFEFARESVQRRLGFRAPFWLEHGIAHLVEAAVHNKGRLDLVHRPMVEPGQNAAGGSLDFESVRWWSREESEGNREREAVAWGLLFLFTEGSPATKKWEAAFLQYVRVLRETGRPDRAEAAFEFARDAELVADWKDRMRKL